MPALTAAEVSHACDELWDTDTNRLPFGDALRIHMAGLKRSINDHADRSDAPFFTYVDTHRLAWPTFAAFTALFDNYEPICGRAETVTSEERAEERRFLDAIIHTKPMKYCLDFLQRHGKIPRDEEQCKRLLGQLWFQPYRRTAGGPLDSSGFEHVFMGEVKNGEVIGCHNWLHILQEERANRLNYKGFLHGRLRASKPQLQAKSDPGSPHVVTMQFDWLGVEKRAGTILLGTSPEFEMALFTMVFLCREVCDAQGKVRVELGDFEVDIVCHDYSRGRNIGTCYVEC